MEERQTNSDRYQLMTPQQLNSRMRKLFGLLPDFNNTFALPKFNSDEKNIDPLINSQKIEFIINRRKKSELKQKLLGQLGNMLSFATITESFKSFIVDRFEREFEIGLIRESFEFEGMTVYSELDRYAKLFQWNSRENGGIFSKYTREIERAAYNMAVRSQLLSIDIAKEEAITPETLDIIQKRKKLVSQWRNEFIKRYEDEP